MIRDVQSSEQLMEKHLLGLLLCQLLATILISPLLSLEMHFRYVTIGLLKRQGIVMVVEKNSASNMLLIVKKGGLVTQRHNEVRDALGDLAAIVYKDVMESWVTMHNT
ncbi:hypothetical protein EMCRGX_G011794 [Ephydatia muelleri]